MDLDAWLGEDLTSDETKEAYKYFMKPEPRDIAGDLEVDPKTGIRSRLMKIGMVRGSKDEDKKILRVYLDPLPHIILEEGKPLQGWYKSKYEQPGVRNRPCFTEAILTQPYGGFCAVGCAFAVYSGEWIDAPSGPRLVDALQVGDVIWGRVPEGIVPTRVSAKIKKWSPAGIRLTLSDGQSVRVNGEHPVWAPRKGGWIEARDLRPGDEVESFSDELVLREVREAYGHTRGEILLGLPEDAVGRGVRGEPAPSAETASRLREVRGADSEPSSEVLRGLRAPSSVRNDGGQSPWGEGASAEVLSLRDSDSPSQEALRRLPRRASSNSPARQHQRARFAGAEEVPGVDGQVLGALRGRADEVAYERAALSVHAEGWGERLPPFQLGMEGGDLPRRGGGPLGVRGGGSGAERGVVPPRFSDRAWPLHRGEGVLEGRGAGEARSLSGRLVNRGVEHRGTQNAGAPRVVDVRQVPAGYVYDLQTATENYYLKGSESPHSPALLVHNCYINSGFKGYRGTGLISVPKGYGEHVRRSLKKMRSSAAGYFSSFTDPFLPLEDVYHNTQEGASAFVDEGLPVFFLSRLKYPSWAYDILRSNPYSYAQKSINCPDPRDWKLLSPGAASLQTHMDDIRELRKAGIYVSIQVNPIVPGVVDHDGVERTLEMLAEAGANHVIVKFVEAGYSWAPSMVERIKFRFGEERGSRFEELFQENVGGQRTIVEEYRMEGHRRYSAAAKRLGLTYATCYEYRSVRDAAGRVVDKTGVSVGKEFLTADQCHGHRVPMFTRSGPDAPFKEVEECPPTGCLSCADDNGGKSRCGSELYGAAAALRSADYKVGVREDGSSRPASRRSLPVLNTEVQNLIDLIE